MTALYNRGIPLVMYFGDADYVCNWIGGEVVSHDVGAEGYESAGFADIQSSDGVTHGVVKQAGHFSFVRVYDSGHEVPFYQPVVSLEMFERVVKGMDIATGKVTVQKDYLTEGPKTSEYINGNSTMVFEVLPTNATYNTTTNMHNPLDEPPTTKKLSKRASKKPRWSAMAFAKRSLVAVARTIRRPFAFSAASASSTSGR